MTISSEAGDDRLKGPFRANVGIVVESKKSVLLRDDRWPWLIIGLTVLIYAWSLSNGFIWDDHDYLLYNPSLSSLKGLLRFWTLSDAFSAFPLTVSALWMEHALWGLSPWGYHVVNLTLHILNALLLFGLVRRLVPPLAGAVALLFAIHPIQVETVAWIAEQKNLWCFFFMMLAFHSFLEGSSSGKARSYVKMFLFFAAALLSKGIAFCFASIPFLYAWWQRGSVSRRDLFLSLSLCFVGALCVLVPLFNESLGSGSDLSEMVLSEKLILAGKNFFFYIKQIVLPWQFLTFYPKWGIDAGRVGNWVFPSAVVALYLMLYLYRQRLGRGAFALLCFYGVSIFPALGFVNISLLSITSAADHFSYLSVPPVLLLCCGAGQALWKRFGLPFFQVSGTLKRGLAFAVVFFLSMLSFRMTLNYTDDVTLFGELVRQCPRSFFAHSRFGVVCVDNPDRCSTDEAIRALERAVLIGPDESLTLSKLGAAYERKGLLEQAQQAYGRASVGQNEFYRAHYFYEIGRVYLAQRKLPEAVSFLEKAVSLRNHPEFMKYQERYRRFQRTSASPEEKSSSYYLLGQAYFLLGDYKKAVEAFRLAIAVAPDWSKNYEGLGASLVNQGDLASALNAFREACRLDPQSQEARNSFEYAIQRIGEKESVGKV